jgi:RNA polymerase sigma-70 factor (ECF subfamily)
MRRSVPPCASGDDASLVERVRGGDVEAFAELYRRHAGGVRCAVSDTVRDPERQRDLVQESFARALAKLDSLREPSQFRPWVLQIARNAATDEWRRRPPAALAWLDDPDSSVELADEEPGPEVRAELDQLAQAIQAGLATLLPREAAAVSLAIHLGFGPSEIAEALDLSQGNARVILHRARRRLQAALELQQLVPQKGA